MRRKESDSGLRAGFIHEDDALKVAQEQARQQEEAELLAREEEQKKEQDVKPAEVPTVKKEEPEGPTISMQGVSGKVITGVVKVVKRVSPKKEEPERETASVSAENVAPVKTSSSAETAMKTVERRSDGEASEPKTEKSAQPEVQTTTADDSVDRVNATPATASPAVKSAETAPAAKPAAKTAKPAVKPIVVPPAEKADQQTPAQVRESVPVKPAAPTKKSVAPAPAIPKPTAVPGKTAMPAAKAPASPTVKAEPGTKQRPLVDRGVQTSRADELPRIRPQKGNYIGRDSQIPAADRRRPSAPRSEQTSTRGGYQRPRTDGGAPGRGPAKSSSRAPGFMDKDRDEAPRQSRSPRQKQRDPRFEVAVSPELTDNKKIDSRKQYAQRNSRDKNRRNQEFDQRGRRNKNQFFQEESVAARRSRRSKASEAPPAPRAVLTQVKLPETLTVREFAEAIKKTTAEVITKLMGYGVMATVNQELDFDTAEVIANEFGIKAELLVEVTEEDILFDDSDDKPEDLKSRPPVVVVMGHVDHGKTSILDYIRKASVAKGEAGGITQHIGAYTVKVHGKPITFLDTPGHEAFTTMRARGAQVTDIAILVVAADDGVMPQTVEAINHARAAETEIIVAINKIDKPGVNLDRVKQELATHDLLPAEWGGSTTMIPVSAKSGENMDELLEMILLTAEVMELKSNPDRQAKGTVIESKLDRGRGPVATVLVQRGTLRIGDTLVVGSIIGHIRAMINDRGQAIDSAGPSIPVEILGLPEVPEGGDIFYAVEDEKVARSLAEKRRVEQREQSLRQSSRMSLENLFSQLERGEVKDLNIIVKGDVQGSVEAVRQSLEKLSNEEIQVQVIHGAVGAVTESDVRLAEVSNAIIIGFNVRPAPNVVEIAAENSVDIRLYRVIYEAIEDMEKAMRGMLDPTFKEQVLGHAEVRELFKVSGVGTIAGCYVTDGKMLRSAKVRVVRDGIVVHEGHFSSLKRFKDDVREVASGYECGIGIERYNDLKVGDQFEAYEVQEIRHD